MQMVNFKIKKEIINCLILSTAMSFTLIGCSNKKEVQNIDSKKNVEVSSNTAKKAEVTANPKLNDDKVKSKSLDDVIGLLKENGFQKVEKVEGLAFGIVGAKDGSNIKIDGITIEVYIYDLDNLSEQAKKLIKEIKEKGTMTLVEGYPTKGLISSNVVIMGYEEHPNKDKLIEVFKGLK